MSALGDYIHYSVAGYANGILAPRLHEAHKAAELQRLCNESRINNIKEISPQTLQALKEVLKGQDLQSAAMEIAKQHLQFSNTMEQFNNYILNFLRVEVGSDSSQSMHLSKPIRGLKPTSSSWFNLEKAKNARKLFNDRIKRLGEYTTVKEKQEQIDGILLSAKEFFKYIGLVQRDLGEILTFSGPIENHIATLQYLINAVSLSEAVQSHIHGTFGEALVAMCDDMLQTVSGDGLVKEVRKKLQEGGAHRTQFMIPKEKIIKKTSTVKEEHISKYFSKTYFSARKAQDKVDVTIVFSPNNSVAEEIHASVKASTPRAGFNSVYTELQGHINLLTSLAATVDDFGLHWINLHAAKINPSGKGETRANSEQIRDFKDKGNEYDQVFKVSLAYEALVKGNLFKMGTQEADTFIVVDPTTKQSIGKVIVMSTKTMLSGENLNAFRFSPNITSIRLQGARIRRVAESDGGASVRIAQVLNKARQTIIRVSWAGAFS